MLQKRVSNGVWVLVYMYMQSCTRSRVYSYHIKDIITLQGSINVIEVKQYVCAAVVQCT